MGHPRTKPQFCKDCGVQKVKGSHNKYKCVSEDCIAKRKAYAKQYRKDNHDTLLDKRRDYVDRNREAVDAYQQQYRQDHKEEHREWGKKHREENKEAIAIQRAGYREQNRELLNERQKVYYQENREDRLAYAKEFRDEKMAPYYKMWDSIIQRIENENNASYGNYGKRGLDLHPEWRESYNVFEEYLETHLGPKPDPSYSIDRIDNNKGYVPGNLRWATKREQTINRRLNREYRDSIPDISMIFYDNRYMSISEFSEIVKIPLDVVKYRYAYLPDPDYILSYKDDHRVYVYKDKTYSLTELCLVAKNTLLHNVFEN